MIFFSGWNNQENEQTATASVVFLFFVFCFARDRRGVFVTYVVSLNVIIILTIRSVSATRCILRIVRCLKQIDLRLFKRKN